MSLSRADYRSLMFFLCATFFQPAPLFADGDELLTEIFRWTGEGGYVTSGLRVRSLPDAPIAVTGLASGAIPQRHFLT